jgi:hypothetical protein
MEKQEVKLVVLFGNKVERARQLLRGHQFDDNGVGPDGPARLARAEDFTPEEIGGIVVGRLGYLADGYEIDDYDGSDEYRTRMCELSEFRWCGYNSLNVAYYIAD